MGLGWLKCCITSTETISLLGKGAQDIHLDFHTARSVSLAGAATSITFVATKVLLRQTRACRDKRVFVATKHVFCREKYLSQEILFCHNKTFIETKMILVTALTNASPEF